MREKKKASFKPSVLLGRRIGFIRIINNPRITLTHCSNILSAAEWELLITDVKQPAPSSCKVTVLTETVPRTENDTTGRAAGCCSLALSHDHIQSGCNL